MASSDGNYGIRGNVRRALAGRLRKALEKPYAVVS